MSYTIGITTFSKRFDMFENLLNKIRKFTNNKIIVCVNGEEEAQFSEEYRKNILQLCSKYEQVFPIFFLEIRGLSKMWNTIINTSHTDKILILNDDLDINSDFIFYQINEYVNSDKLKCLTKINNSFSHFLVNKQAIINIGYFDERLLGFGEEDGDITYRILKNNMSIENLYLSGLVNIISQTRHDSVKAGIGKYSKFNREYIYDKKYSVDFNSNIKGLFDTPMKQVIDDIDCYPMEKYYQENKNKL